MQPSLKPPLTTAQKQQRYRVWHDADPERRVICRKSKKNGEKTWRLTKRRQLKTLVRGESIYNGESGGLPQEQGQERNFDKLDHPSRQPAAIPSAVPRAEPRARFFKVRTTGSFSSMHRLFKCTELSTE